MYARYKNAAFTELVGNIDFSPTVYQTPESLTPEQRVEFDVFNIIDVIPALPANHILGDQPTYEVSGTNIIRTWPVVEMSAEAIAANQAAAAAALQSAIIGGAQQRLDDFARTRNYDGILSLCTYATDTNPRFAAEGQCGVQSRSATWAALYTILAEVTAGTRPVPTGYADIEPDLPELVWPT